MNVLRNISVGNGSPERGSAQRGRAPARVWKLTALALLLPACLWLVGVLLAPANTVEFAEHMAEEGEHCEPYGYHVPPVVEKPHLVGPVEDQSVDLRISAPVATLQAHPHLARDHPPPLFYSLSHSLRAPPTLIPA